ncbi:MAG: 2-C-methyl-D-erythritol 4-phosphate cytidylyltransferase, partial [bacterium]|nr:2-C-methyl-D-erythritol 4-phosphate cytidylyltransferase [bacterium]
DENNLIKQVPDRKYLRRVQTPQAFQARVIREAHQSALQKGFSGATDDCSLVLNMNPVPIYVVEGSPSNIKITYPIDLHLAEKILDTFR